ncbi:MAG: DNA polymerase III subunit alpha [Lentisphaerae bacterium]|nr:DNA polymerase III subunit alpha [Lentisphaerota bacterium]
MSVEPFVHLHLHTCYSMLDGACRVPDIMDIAEEQNMPAVAITDHGVMYGAIDFYRAARDRGINPVIGCETYVAPGSRFDRKSDNGKAPHFHLVLLAADRTGYENLVRLVSAAHLEGFYYKPRIDKELLAQHAQGLIALSGCLHGEPARHLLDGNPDAAAATLNTYADILGKDNVFIEIQDHNIPEQRRINKHMPALSRKTGLPLVATNDVHYVKKEHAAAHEVLLCLQTQTVLSDPNRMRYRTQEFYMKSRAEMEQLFRDVPDALANTVRIAERCRVELEFGRPHFPTFRVPEGVGQKQYLTRLVMDGIRRHYGVKDPAHPADDRERAILKRFNEEVAVIEKTGFINYFLVVWDFMRFAHEQRIPVGPGRGSGGGSLTAYALGITSIDPLRYGLIFERFLNPERVSPPDFDIDFCQARRGEVIEYVKQKYGRDNVAQIVTFGSLGPRSVIRDVGRVLEIPYAVCDRFSKMVPEEPKMTLARALEMNPEFQAAYDNDPDCRRILDYAFVLEGLYRNPGTHAAGVVIGERPLVEIVPLALDKDRQPVTQYTMEPLGDIGLLKMDFLGLKTLTVLQEAVTLVARFRGETLDLDNLPFDDRPTYDLLNRGDTIGVFQLESAGMRDLARRVGIDGIEDLIAMIALYRPGPMNMLPDYVDRKTGKAKVKYDDPRLEPILKETYGVMLYQEQVQKAANILAGYSLGDADILRRAMGKKKMEVMENERERFIKGCAETHDMPARKAGRIFDVMAQFAGYGFCKAHSTGYAIIAYQTAYLKANYPAEFMSALLSCEIGNFDKLPVFINEAAAMGLKIYPPDVNRSGVRFEPREDGILFGLAGIKNVGHGVAEAIVAGRADGPYTSLIGFCSRVDGQLANKKVLESLVRSGALDSLRMHRARLFHGIDFAMSRAASDARDRAAGQQSLFALLEEPTAAAGDDALPDCAPWHESALLAGERELLGVYMSGHPLAQYAGLLQRYQLTDVSGLAALDDRTLTRLGGIIAQVNRKLTKKKEAMAVVHLEDLDGCVEALVFPDVYQKYGMYLEDQRAVLVCGEVTRREEPPKLIAYEIYPLEEAPRHFTRRLGVHIAAAAAENGRLQRVKDILKLHPGDVPAVICLQFPKGEKVFLDTAKALRVNPEEALVEALEKELGEKSVYIAVNPSPCKNSRARRNGRGRL